VLFREGVELCHGHFNLGVFRRGALIEIMDEPNLVVNGSRALMAALVGGSVSNNSLTQIAFGTSLTAPASGNTAITSSYAKPFDGVSYPVAGSVTFAFSLGSGEANGMAIGEFGLLTPTGVLFARKTRSAALAKDTDLSLSGSWTLTF